jgi:hypothetical protein
MQDNPLSHTPSSETAAAHPHHDSNQGMGGLAVQLLDDVVRVVEAEVKLLEVNFGSALTAALDRAVGRFLAVLLLFLGVSCLLAGLIIWLSHSLGMPQALAVAGAVAIAAAYAVARVTGRIAKNVESDLTESRPAASPRPAS